MLPAHMRVNDPAPAPAPGQGPDKPEDQPPIINPQPSAGLAAMSKGTPCITDRCGGTAKGGHRYCPACLTAILSGPPSPPPIRESGVRYTITRKKRGTS